MMTFGLVVDSDPVSVSVYSGSKPFVDGQGLESLENKIYKRRTEYNHPLKAGPI